MSRRLVAYGSDDESPDRRKPRDESHENVEYDNEQQTTASESTENNKSGGRKIRKNSERWTASSGEESADDEESESSSVSEKLNDDQSSVFKETVTGNNDKKVDNLKVSRIPGKGSEVSESHLLPTQSQSSLVSYGAGDDEEDDQFARADKQAIEMIQEKQDRDDRSRSSTVIREPKPPRGHEDSRSPDEIAVDNILDEGVRELAHVYAHTTENSIAGSTPHSFDGVESPLPTEAEEEVVLPPTPPGRCSPKLEQRFEAYFKRKSAGVDLNLMIKKRRDFKNPSMYEQLIEKFHVDELGSNFNPRVFDPHEFSDDCFYDNIGTMQKELMEKHNAAIEKKIAASKAEAGKIGETKRKSRFDGVKKH
uniref:SAP30-binding protein n=1 Tax=Syphacia muris TaxID=451379 RepID=A0A0N5ASS3_9BILA